MSRSRCHGAHGHALRGAASESLGRGRDAHRPGRYRVTVAVPADPVVALRVVLPIVASIVTPLIGAIELVDHRGGDLAGVGRRRISAVITAATAAAGGAGQPLALQARAAAGCGS